MDSGLTHDAPVWKQPRGRYGSNYWTAYSPKLRRNVNCYSNLERDNWVLVESNPHVISFCEAPVRIRMKIDGRDVQTIPDMFVRFRNGHEEYQEIKYVRDLERVQADERRARQIVGQANWCAIAGVSHQVITEQFIRANPLYLVNWKRLLAHLPAASTVNLTTQQDHVYAIMDVRPVWRLAELEQACLPLAPQVTRLIVFQLLHRGELVAPLDRCLLNGALEIRRRI